MYATNLFDEEHCGLDVGACLLERGGVEADPLGSQRAKRLVAVRAFHADRGELALRFQEGKGVEDVLDVAPQVEGRIHDDGVE